MRYLAALSLAAFSSILPCISQAAPANDRIANATPFDANISLNRLRSNVTGATGDDITFLLPNSSVGFSLSNFPVVWTKWTAPVAGTVIVQGVATGFTVWGITIAGPLDQSSYPLVGSDLISTIYANGNSVMDYTYPATAGVTYYNGILIDDIRTNNAYTYVHRFAQDPLSDSFANATQMGGTDFTITGNNAEATKEEGEPDHSANPIFSTDKSIWTKWTSPNSRKSVTVKVTARLYAPVLAVYTGDALNNLKLVARGSASTSQDGSVSTANFVAEDGVEYHFAIDGSDNKSGAFKLEFKATTVRPGFITQPVATTVEQNQTAILTATAAYTGDTVSYQWQRLPAGSKTWGDISDDSTFGGTQTATLSILATLDMNNDRYRVRAEDSVGSSNSRAVLLTVTEFPAVSTEVLGTVNTTIAASSLPPPSNGGTYFATGLPKGLTLDPETGAITGIATAKPGTYRVVYGTTDGKTKNPQTYVLQVIVAPFAPLLTGSFEALLVSPDAQAVPQGKLTLKVAANGSYTGSYFSLAEGKAYAYRGTVELNQAARSAGTPAGSPVIISRGKSLSPLALELSLSEPISPDDPESLSTLSASITDVNDVVLAIATDGVPTSRFNAANPAAWSGRYTISLTSPTFIAAPATTTTPAIPLGSGYATGTIAANTGAFSLRGYLADGTLFTANLAGSRAATYRAGQRLYGPGGSLGGKIKFTQALSGDLSVLSYHSDEASGSSLFWSKPTPPTPPTPSKKLYPAGFDSGAVKLTTVIEAWTNPAGNLRAALGLAAAGDMKVRIEAQIPQDGNNSDVYSLPVDVRLAANGALSFVSPNTNRTKFSVKFDQANGTFTGSYELAEASPAPGVKPRKVSFQGVLLKRPSLTEGDVIGAGFAVVPPLGVEEVTTAALIEFHAGPPESLFGIGPDL